MFLILHKGVGVGEISDLFASDKACELSVYTVRRPSRAPVMEPPPSTRAADLGEKIGSMRDR